MLELFHAIGDEDSARARRRAAELFLLDGIALRNVHFESHRKALADRGGSGTVPALWDGSELHEGLPRVLAALEAGKGR